MKYSAVVFVACLVLLTGCFRTPRLMPGMYVTYDGRIEAADPELVRVDWERRLSVEIGTSFALERNPRVAIAEQPEVGDKGHYQWADIAIHVQQLSDAPIELHGGDLVALVSERLQAVLQPGAQVKVDYRRFSEAP